LGCRSNTARPTSKFGSLGAHLDQNEDEFCFSKEARESAREREPSGCRSSTATPTSKFGSLGAHLDQNGTEEGEFCFSERGTSEGVGLHTRLAIPIPILYVKWQNRGLGGKPDIAQYRFQNTKGGKEGGVRGSGVRVDPIRVRVRVVYSCG